MTNAILKRNPNPTARSFPPEGAPIREGYAGRRFPVAQTPVRLVLAFGAVVAWSAVRDASPGQAPWYAQTADWMTFVHDDTPIGLLTMPGSHDAGMCNTRADTWSDAYYCTQYDTVLTQLKAGSRFFDLRPYLKNGTLWTYHAPLASDWFLGTGESVWEVLADIRKFLTAHPSETVFCDFSHWSYKNDSYDEIAMATKDALFEMIQTNGCDALLYKCPAKWADNPPVLNQVPLREVRGKIVLLCESTALQPENGIWGYWATSDSATAKGAPHRKFLNAYDNYSNEGDYTPMKDKQIQRWAENNACPTNWAFVLKWTLTLDWAGIQGGAEDVNRWLVEKELDPNVATNGRPLVVSMDYVASNVCAEIIKYNAEVAGAHLRGPNGRPILSTGLEVERGAPGGGMTSFRLYADGSVKTQDVSVAHGVDPRAVTVYVRAHEIDAIRRSGADLRILKNAGGQEWDITLALDIPVADGVSDLRQAGVKADYAHMPLDPDFATFTRTTLRDAGISEDGDCMLWDFLTTPGLVYEISSGAALDAMRPRGSVEGDGERLKLPLRIDSPSAFMSVDVTW